MFKNKKILILAILVVGGLLISFSLLFQKIKPKEERIEKPQMTQEERIPPKKELTSEEEIAKREISKPVDKKQEGEKLNEEAVKQEVMRAIDRIKHICLETDDLEAIGFGTMKEAGTIFKIGKPAIPILLKVLEDRNEDWKVRFFMSEILKEIPNEKIEPLIEIFQDKEEKELLRRSVASTLGAWGNKKAVPFLIQGLQEASADFRLTIINALGRLKDKRAVQSLSNFLDDPEVGMPAVRALGNIGSKEALELLIKKLNEDKKSGFKNQITDRAVVHALSKIGGEKAEDILINILNDKEAAALRIEAAMGLGKMKSKKSISYLIEALEEEDELLQIKSAEALFKMGVTSAIPEIKKAIEKSRDNYTKEVLSHLLRKLEKE